MSSCVSPTTIYLTLAHGGEPMKILIVSIKLYHFVAFIINDGTIIACMYINSISPGLRATHPST